MPSEKEQHRPAAENIEEHVGEKKKETKKALSRLLKSVPGLLLFRRLRPGKFERTI
jgi:hypothetical protein